jgi:intein-encoded DNA endonuclease-like protein
MSHLQSLIEERLQGSLVEFLELSRSHGMTYREVAQSLTKETGITVSKSAVHKWLSN